MLYHDDLLKIEEIARKVAREEVVRAGPKGGAEEVSPAMGQSEIEEIARRIAQEEVTKAAESKPSKKKEVTENA